MQFNSFIFILLFLPLTIIAYYLANRINYLFGKIVIVVASVIFYAYSNWSMLIVLGISLLINYTFSLLIKKNSKWNKIFLVTPVAVNIGLLLYFKYLNFAITSISQWLGKDWRLKELLLPAGISFFTFQQIAYVVAVHKKRIENCSLLDYLVYILFFPKILMGPLTDPVDFITQINNVSQKKVNWDNVACGVKLFSFGLFKKLMIADVCANAVSWGYSNIETATSVDWILIMLFYTFEIYFDFSGYSDMAVGTASMLNIILPINFDSPYKALSIRDFWRRWHISLTKFFTTYVYVPLGGSHKGKLMTYVNTMIVFFISGIWHGANWTFILWGLFHGIFMVFDRIFENVHKKVFEPVKWFLTFLVVNILWLLFRSDSVEQWKNILKTIVFLQDTTISDELINIFSLQETSFLKKAFHLEFFADNIRGFWMMLFLFASFGICLVPENNYKAIKKLSVVSMLLAFISFVWVLFV